MIRDIESHPNAYPNNLEELFLEAALKRSELLRNDVQLANDDKIHRLKEDLRAQPDRGEAILKRVAGHPNADVQILAIAALLAIDETYAIEALEQIADSDNGLA